ncbi:MAG: membrane protein insertase YidC [Candidatus Omnitrophica bacterium]|nr:membrane protein insertase YidC [Candidatus Omnitrophota bacterium]
MSRDPEMERNYFLAIVLSLLVVVGYPLFMQKTRNPNPIGEEAKIEENKEDVSGGQSERDWAEETPSASAIQIPTKPSIETFENDLFYIEFTSLGGAISKLVYKGEHKNGGVDATSFFDQDSLQTGIFGTKISHENIDLTQAIFGVKKGAGGKEIVEFSYEKPEEFRLVKRYYVDSEHPVLGQDMIIENLSSRTKHFPVEFVYGMQYDLSDSMIARSYELVARTDKIESANIHKIAKKGYDLSAEITWAGLIKRYYALIVNPDWKIIHISSNTDKESAKTGTLYTTLRMEPISIEPGQKIGKQFFVYAGPQRYETLKSFNMGFEKILTRGFLGNFKIWILLALKFIYRYTHNYGWAIILFTLLLKGVFLPLTHQSSKQMKKMQALNPKVKALQERLKSDPQKMQKELTQLYKRNKVNPAAGCLPMLIQMPIFIAMFRLLPEAVELKGAPFIWWIKDLSQPDRLLTLPFTIPLLGWDAINLVPIVMVVSQFWYQKTMPQPSTSNEQAKIMAFMPVFFGFICYNMPSGLVLYWFMQNIFSVIHQVFINKIVVVLHHEDRE